MTVGVVLRLLGEKSNINIVRQTADEGLTRVDSDRSSCAEQKGGRLMLEVMVAGRFPQRTF